MLAAWFAVTAVVAAGPPARAGLDYVAESSRCAHVSRTSADGSTLTVRGCVRQARAERSDGLSVGGTDIWVTLQTPTASSAWSAATGVEVEVDPLVADGRIYGVVGPFALDLAFTGTAGPVASYRQLRYGATAGASRTAAVDGAVSSELWDEVLHGAPGSLATDATLYADYRLGDPP
jgi:hypothetical protein